jgi:hypothetical protein
LSLRHGEDVGIMTVGEDRVEQESPPVHEIQPSAAADEDAFDDDDDLDDMDFLLDEIENRIAPLA